MGTTEAIVGFLVVNVLAWITPGPNMIAVISASLSGGLRAGLATAAGLALASVIWASLAVLGVSILFELFPWAVQALRLTGAAYLFWIGVRSLRSALQDVPPSTPERARLSWRKAFRRGLLVSMGNPKAALFYGSILTAFVPAHASAPVLIGVVAVCGVLAMLLHTITATLFSTPQAMAAFARGRRAIDALFGLILTGLGGTVIWSVLRRS
ncbi:LysE family translocator [Ruegeria sp. HKCCD8929]|uniref:LysE family translocator n=1 Tax=Ruegeria sp. HKCCD8929 TaxID=2683006 RepID=UPI001488C801|nr:LysE family transporter [Ruegeria sp. HKCCD8929]